MMKKAASIGFWVMLISTTCFGQMSYQGISPGISLRSDVSKAFGQPLTAVSETLLQYTPPREDPGVDKLYVQYRKGTQIVERLETLLLRPLSRAQLVKQFGLPQQADAKKTDANGRLQEFFGPRLLVVTYLSSDPASGVSRLGYL